MVLAIIMSKLSIEKNTNIIFSKFIQIPNRPDLN